MKRQLLIKTTLLAASALGLNLTAGAQLASLTTVLGERPVAQAATLTAEPIIDGDVLNDPVWQQVEPLGEMIQNQPKSGQPPSEKTEIRIAYTATTLYVSAVCYDSSPQRGIISDSRRDADLENTDAFMFILDTYHDGQNGFVFGTNAAGIEYDAQVDNEGQGNFGNVRQQGGVIGGFNLNWDAAWTVKTFTGDFGWSCEFAIPLRTIRFRSGQNITWGANFRRNIRKYNEIDYWASLPIEFDLKRLSLAGDLTGLNLQSPGNLKIMPYVLGQVARNYEATPSKTKFTPEFGGDVKYSITPNMTLDLTYNTDFAQVEVDEQQVNLDRFNLFFPEKRPFFLENAGQFSVGSPGEVDLFFSRRIGIGEGGSLVPIIGGARLSGKVKRTNIGFLNLFTEEVEDANVQANNFTVARVNHEFPKRSAIGAMFVNRQGMGELDDDFNRTFAVDGKYGIGTKAQLSGFFAKTLTPGIESDDIAFKMQSQYEWNGLNLNLAYTQVEEGFNPEVGFLQRSAFRKPEALVLQRIRMNGKWNLLEIRPHVSYRGYWDFEGRQQTGFLHIDNHWEFQSGMEIHSGINYTTEGVFEPFEISKDVIVPTGTYNHWETLIVFWTNLSKPLYLNTRTTLGGFFGGNRYSTSATLGLRIGDKFNSEFTVNRNDVHLPGGDFTANILRARVSYSFTPRIYIQSLVQYNNVADIWSANLRFGWLQTANTGLFIVFNETHGDFGPQTRSFIVKYSRMFDVLK